MTISVLTIVRGRRQHLENQLKGLLQSTRLPDEWVIVGMDDEVSIEPETPFPVVTSQVHSPGRSLPLAEARNRAAELSRGDLLVFLDVDCIPSPTMIDHFESQQSQHPGLWMGSIGYLPEAAADGEWEFERLQERAVIHPLQPRLKEGEAERSDHYEMFWSLCFSCDRDGFRRIKGFDESYDGYGGEDTDFAFRARRVGVPFGHLGAIAYHQHHAVCKPPLNHFEAIVRNAQTFRSKWNQWAMQSWLNAFAELGLVDFDESRDLLKVRRLPTLEEVEGAKTTTPAGF